MTIAIAKRGSVPLQAFIGPVLIASFTGLSAVRDTFLSGALREQAPIVIAALTFAITNLTFAPFLIQAALRKCEACRGAGGLAAQINLSTAAAWLLYFVALAHSSPAVVITIWSAAGPLFAAWLLTRSRWGDLVGATGQIGPNEKSAYRLQLLLALTLAFGFGGVEFAETRSAAVLFGNLGALASGLAITLSVLQSQALAKRGFVATEIMGLRFQLTGVIAFGALAISGPPAAALLDPALVGVAALVAVLIVAPNFVLQVGILRTHALTAKVIMSFAPSLTFALQTLFLGLPVSIATAVAVGLFFVLTVCGAVARARGV
jgi:hypothetical protein